MGIFNPIGDSAFIGFDTFIGPPAPASKSGAFPWTVLRDLPASPAFFLASRIAFKSNTLVSLSEIRLFHPIFDVSIALFRTYGLVDASRPIVGTELKELSAKSGSTKSLNGS